MTDLTVRKLEMCVRVVGFLVNKPMVFRKGSQGPLFVERFKQAVAEIRELIAKQMTDVAAAHASSGARSSARGDLREAMARISRCARGMVFTIPELDEKFRMPRSEGDAVMLARAHSFAENAALYQKDFITFEMAPDFVDDLNAKIQIFERAFSDHTANKATHVATAQEIDDAVSRATTILFQLDPIIDNKLDGNSMLMSQWKNVRQTERAWVSKKKKPVPNPEPAPEPSPGQVPNVHAA